MIKTENKCKVCKKFTANDKLIRFTDLNKKHCKKCGFGELVRPNKPTHQEINNFSTDILEKQKKLVRPAEFVKNNISRDEAIVLNYKYKTD